MENKNIFHFLFLPKGKNIKAEHELIIISLVTTNDILLVYLLQSLLTTLLIGALSKINIRRDTKSISLNIPINKVVKRDWRI